MSKQLKHSLSRSAALVGVMAAASVSAGTAHAAQINSIGNIQVGSVASGGPGGSSCRIGAVFNYTFTTNDGVVSGQPRDWVHVAITDINGNPSPAVPTTFSQAWGAPALINQSNANFTTGFLTFNMAPRTAPTPLYFTIFEATTSAASGRGAILAQTLIPDLQLRQAQGACLFVRANNEPTSNAGPAQTVGQGATVTLDGSASSDIDGDPIVNYAWSQVSGPAATLTNPNSQTPTFTAPPVTAPTDLFFDLIVNDGTSNSNGGSTVKITVLPNQPPSVNAGPDETIASGASVSLAATASDTENDPMTFTWSQLSGPSVTLSSTTTLTSSFTAPAKTNSAQDIVLQFAANDGFSTAIDTVIYTIPANVGPSANAGADATIPPDQTYTFSSGSSDGDGDPLTYIWTQLSGTTVTIPNPTLANASFSAPAITAAAQPLVFQLEASDGLLSATDTVTLTVPANTAPVATASAAASAGQGSTVSLDGTGSSDVDNQMLTYTWTQTSGPAVTLTGANTAMPSFVVPAVTSPTPLVFELIVNDGIANSAPQSVTITALPNAPPVVNAGSDQNIVEGDSVTLAATATDPETDPLTFSWSQTSGTTVALSSTNALSTGFVAPPKANAVQTLTFEFAANDGFTTSTDSVDVLVAANVGPTANAGPDATVTANVVAGLDGSASTDGDGDPIIYLWTQTGGPAVTLSNTTIAAPTFTAPPIAATAQSLTFSLQVHDGLAVSTDTVALTVPANIAPVANAGLNANAGQGSTVSLDGSASSDADNQPLTYVWTQTGGPAVTLTNANTASPSFVVPSVTAPTPLVFELVVNDGIASSSPQTVTVTALPNAPPIVNAGPDQATTGGAAVNLSASVTDTENDPLIFSWTQTAGPAVSLTGPTTLAPAFTAPSKAASAQTLTFELAANDGFSTSTDTVDVLIAANISATANAGADATAAPGSLVSLDGSGSSDGDGDPITYQWQQSGGPSVTLAGAGTAMPSFTAPGLAASAQLLVFDLRVSDGISAPVADSVVITIPANVAPVANAGANASAGQGSTVTLDGTASSDADSQPLTYAWTQTSGPAVSLTNANTATPSFVVPAVVTPTPLVFQLVVNDGIFSSVAQNVTVTALPNAPPVVSAGPDQSTTGGASVTLAGTATDPESDPLTFIWSQTAGPAVTLSSPSALTPSFTAPAKTALPQTLTFSLTANDGISVSSPDAVDILIAGNVGPTANAGTVQNVSGGQLVTLNGGGSNDGDNDALTYAWVQASGPSVTLSNAAAANPTFTAPLGVSAAQTLGFELTVSDGIATSSATASVVVAANATPTANAGPDQGPIDSGQTVTLDGSDSFDPDSDPLSYSWTQLSGTAVTLSGANTTSPTFTAPLVNGAEDLTFQLTVSDGQVVSTPDVVRIAVQAIGTVSLVQRVTGADRPFAFSSPTPALSGTITTVNGEGTLAAVSLAAGSYRVTAEDLSALGYAVTDISCNDSDSLSDLGARAVDIQLSPNEDLVCTFTSADTRSAAVAAIGDFLSARNAALLSMQPTLQRRLDRLAGSDGASGSASIQGFAAPGGENLPFRVAMQDGNVAVSTSLLMARNAVDRVGGGRRPDGDDSSNAFDLWGEAYLSRLKYEDHEGDFSLYYVGADYRFSDSLLAGALVQFDEFSHDQPGATGAAEGDGWMAGPYVTARLAPDLYLDARAAWGSSNNSVAPLGTFTDTFDTKRTLYAASLVGQYKLDASTRLQPELSIRHLNESQKAYRDAFNILVPGQDVSQGELSFKPQVARYMPLNNEWTLRPFGSLEGIYTFDAASGSALNDDLRLRVEGGVDLYASWGFRVSFSGFQDGIGTGGFGNDGFRLMVSFQR